MNYNPFIGTKHKKQIIKTLLVKYCKWLETDGNQLKNEKMS